MPQLDQLSVCPSCAEPLEEGDRFCGACGTDLVAAAAHGAGAAGPAGDGGTPDRNGAGPAVARVVGSGAGGSGGSGAAGSGSGTAGSGAASAGAVGSGDMRAGDAGAGPGAWGSVPAPTPPPPAVPAPTGPTPAEPDYTLPPPGDPGATSPGPGTPDPRTADPRTAVDEPGGAAPSGEPHNGQPPGGLSSGPEALGPTCVACGTGTIDDDGYCEHCGHKQPRERDHMESALDTVAAASDRGLRHHRNEDFYAVTETETAEGRPATIAVICDGVSSATRPDEASAAAAEAASVSLRAALPRGCHPQQAMHDALIAAAEAVNALAKDGPVEPSKNAPACTIVSALTAEGILTVGWVGDSRAYWIPDDRTAQAARLTEDDSWAAQMVAAGLMNEAEAYADSRAHAITGWLGADAYELDPHTASFKPDRPGVVVVCTDGLWNYAESAEEMAAAVPPDALARPLHSAQHLVGYALDGGGHDNVTVAVVPFPAQRGRAGSA
ncbi:PP2C family serine/threonine-protein phosphatase [Streptomyces axinellae]|uniref:PPM-type phosphatase domain-containing protein n=1 Tax=Streptomyces axinellae TaxID=552788 RepID=A0ABP6C3H7_9ACTN